MRLAPWGLCSLILVDGCAPQRVVAKSPATDLVVSGRYTNAFLGLTSELPPGVTALVNPDTGQMRVRLNGDVTALLAFDPTPPTVDARGEMFREIYRHIAPMLPRDSKLDVTDEGAVDTPIGIAWSQRWRLRVARGGTGSRSLIYRYCDGAGALILYELWLDEFQMVMLRRWRASFRAEVASEIPACASTSVHGMVAARQSSWGTR